MELNSRILCIRGRCLHRRRRNWDRVRGSEEPKSEVKDYDGLTLDGGNQEIIILMSLRIRSGYGRFRAGHVGWYVLERNTRGRDVWSVTESGWLPDLTCTIMRCCWTRARNCKPAPNTSESSPFRSNTLHLENRLI